MSKKRVLIILGLMVALLPFLGVPRAVKDFLSVALGLVIAGLAFLLKRRASLLAAEERNGTFAQNKPYNGVSEGERRTDAGSPPFQGQ